MSTDFTAGAFSDTQFNLMIISFDSEIQPLSSASEAIATNDPY